MQPTPEIESFISRVVALPPGPGVTLDAVLQPSIDDEAELRKLFAQDRQNARLENPYIGLVDVFAAPEAIRTTRARVVEGKEDLSAQHIMPLDEKDRRKEGTPSMVTDLEDFKKNWAIFSEGSLSQLIDWNNVVAAGGSVLACLTPLDEKDKTSKRAIRKFYHNNAYPTSDIDLFLWGLNAEQAEAKIKTIYEAVRDSVPWDVTCIRTKHTVSIHSQYPYRSVQIVLRLYHSPAEILAGFDIDAPCCAYDGTRVWANPRAIVAMMRQCNTVDMTRRSPSYEIRLAKYSRRAFEVYVPGLKRSEIDPTIYERSVARMEGLARLLVLEKLSDDTMRTAFLEGRRNLRGRTNQVNRYNRRYKRKYKGDLKEESEMGIEMNDYDVASLHIPYGPGWDARRIDKLVYQTDLGMNSTFNPKNKGRRLHRHPAFFGTVEECLEDCCEYCPEPIDDDERQLQKEEEEIYINGRIKFIEENPGRQTMTGSFNPIDVGEWSDQVYIKPTQQLFTAIAARDRAAVQELLKQEIDVNQRDYVGRTTLHVAIAVNAADIAADLIDAGARITARLADGRAPLHLAAIYDQPAIITKLLERSIKNAADFKAKEEAEEAEAAAAKMDTDEAGRRSSEDDWSSHDDEDAVMSAPEDADDEAEEEEDEDEDDDEDEDEDDSKKKKKAKKEETHSPEDEAEEDDQPDVIAIDEFDWEFGFSALSYAIVYGSLTTLNALIEGGANPKTPSKQTDLSSSHHPLTFTILREDEDEACKIAERLLQLPSVTSSTADTELRTIFHHAVTAGRRKLVETLLRCDPHAITVLNFPSIDYQNVAFPVVTAIRKRHFAVLGVLLAYGAKLELDEPDVTKALDAATPDIRSRVTGYGSVKNYLGLAYQPMEVAVNAGDDVAKLLIALGATIDFGLRRSMHQYSSATERRSLKDWVEYAMSKLSKEITEKTEEVKVSQKKAEEASRKAEKMDTSESPKSGWKEYLEAHLAALASPKDISQDYTARVNMIERHRKEEELDRLIDVKNFLADLQGDLIEKKAKSWQDIYPAIETQATMALPSINTPFYTNTTKDSEAGTSYVYLAKTSYNRSYVPEHLTEKYDELYEACFAGDNEKIQALCLPIEGQETNFSQGVPSPLKISVRLIDASISKYNGNGYTPLYAAISGRRWSTAKLILAIATAQYSTDDEEQISFKLDDVKLDEDSDDDDGYDSEGSDETIEKQEIKFIDIATRPSAVKSEIHPKQILDTTTPTLKSYGNANPLTKSVLDKDLEAFVHIANLYQSALPQAVELDSTGVLDLILQEDQADILDEYIRRTGDGIDIDVAKKVGDVPAESELPIATNDVNKIYLGLNVHGKKRTDLAKKNDPNATGYDDRVVYPLVWRAASSKAKDILTYLNSNRPLSAYKFYAVTHSDPKALWLRRVQNDKNAGNILEKKLSTWLGWLIRPLGDSPLTAAVIADDLDTIKLLSKLQPALIAEALQTKLKFVGETVLSLAVACNHDTKVIDYLLSRKVSAVERSSTRWWNLYHLVCWKNNGNLLEYLLKKLPRDVNEQLLVEQSKGRLNTPLHLAVKGGSIRLVKILLAYSHSGLLIRDVDGRIPLHTAVSKSYKGITQELLAVVPAETLHMEDCVGNSPLDIAALQELRQRVRNFTSNTQYRSYEEIASGGHKISGNPLNLFVDNADKIVEMLAGLEETKGKYRAKIISVVNKWAAQREPKLPLFREQKRLEEEKRKEHQKLQTPTPVITTDPTDEVSVEEVWKLVHEAGLKAPSTVQRRLVHLFEVQQSVGATLSKARGEDGNDTDEDQYNRYSYRRRRRARKQDNEGQLDDEESEERQERRQMLGLNHLPTSPDNN
ncbi:ankyrin [Pholiota conissans]|uniref:Ankyrin n=1 Tax=Pholiota conissans TaxID=109636 RepID=A0A9P6CX65_9AGAR|nr:ankyrin [Pholiota conissans]